jgi:DNA-binding ferritin-like protein (Dps family)
MTMSEAEKGGFVSKVIGDKRRWRAHKARVRQLPPNYRTAVEFVDALVRS